MFMLKKQEKSWHFIKICTIMLSSQPKQNLYALINKMQNLICMYTFVGLHVVGGSEGSVAKILGC